MLIIECPWCGPCDQTEYSYQGEAHIVRPKTPDQLTDEQWGEYVFFRKNSKGMHYERWLHIHGCRRWFNAVRDTVEDKFYGSYKPGDPIVEIEK